MVSSLENQAFDTQIIRIIFHGFSLNIIQKSCYTICRKIALNLGYNNVILNTQEVPPIDG